MSILARLDRMARARVRPPFSDEDGRKGVFELFSRAQSLAVRHIPIEVAGWPALSRPLRVAFLSDFHTGSHAGDVARLRAVVAQAANFRPDLVLLGGDYVNMQLFGGGRVPPRVVASILAGLEGPSGRFAILGNHDFQYGEQEVVDAFREAGIAVLHDETGTIAFEGHALRIAGIPDARVERRSAYELLAALADEPTIVLAHDPIWFAHVPPGPHLTLAGHTHGGQIRLPGVGALVTFSEAPRRWSYGLVNESGRLLYVTSGIGTSGVPVRIGAPPEIVLLEIGAPSG